MIMLWFGGTQDPSIWFLCHSKCIAFICMVPDNSMPTFQPSGRGKVAGSRQAPSLRTLPRNCRHHFCKHPISHNFNSWSHLAPRKTGNCRLYSGWSHAPLNFSWHGRRGKPILRENWKNWPQASAGCANSLFCQIRTF